MMKRQQSFLLMRFLSSSSSSHIHWSLQLRLLAPSVVMTQKQLLRLPLCSSMMLHRQPPLLLRSEAYS
jgi:hypothetical protein